MTMGIGDRFQEETKYLRGKLSGSLDWSNKPNTYKDYPGSETVELSIPKSATSISFDETAKKEEASAVIQQNLSVKRSCLTYCGFQQASNERRETMSFALFLQLVLYTQLKPILLPTKSKT